VANNHEVVSINSYNLVKTDQHRINDIGPFAWQRGHAMKQSGPGALHPYRGRFTCQIDSI